MRVDFLTHRNPIREQSLSSLMHSTSTSQIEPFRTIGSANQNPKPYSMTKIPSSPNLLFPDMGLKAASASNAHRYIVCSYKNKAY
ncbi:hypothetical protein TNCV_1128591 [Trichonephila clavipes]|nr:hypothetical protein TNCV_1128591 [Trichonephila clavipes]